MPSTRQSRLRSVDVARYLGVTHQRVTQMVAEGKLPAPRHDPVGPLWTPSVIERWAEREWWGTKPWRIPGIGVKRVARGPARSQ
ncbi:MAG: helix-turn-helix domain-containing protein [Gemmatimonadota bacterium]|nr:helix-turn-helix domain-containing protein [Gemmatimonadota bacterium]